MTPFKRTPCEEHTAVKSLYSPTAATALHILESVLYQASPTHGVAKCQPHHTKREKKPARPSPRPQPMQQPSHPHISCRHPTRKSWDVHDVSTRQQSKRRQHSTTRLSVFWESVLSPALHVRCTIRDGAKVRVPPELSRAKPSFEA
jgi:hypothetical protein